MQKGIQHSAGIQVPNTLVKVPLMPTAAGQPLTDLVFLIFHIVDILSGMFAREYMRKDTFNHFTLHHELNNTPFREVTTIFTCVSR